MGGWTIRMVGGVVFTVLAMGTPAGAATLCVNGGGTGGCFSSIGAAVAAAVPGDTIRVGHGTYRETVTIEKPLSLIGDNRANTVIDATGLPYGVNIDGLDNPGLVNVSVTGFTVANAKFEGILISNSSNIMVSWNRVVNNDRGLMFPDCPGLLPPDSAAGEGFDCGEGIHLSGVDHATIYQNIIESNAGGVLLSDDSGPTHDNVISSNVVENNAFDCGITLASHKPVAPNGVYHNTITGNDVVRNGLLGQGAGIGLFAPIPGTATYGNLIASNDAVGNGLPGVALHSHAPGQNVNDNVIVGNHLADNGFDDDAETPGTTGIVIFSVSPITGTVISQNTFEREDIAIAVKTTTAVEAHRNDLNNHKIGVANLSTGSVDATNNWWGCARGPNAPGCADTSGGGIVATPFLSKP